MPQIKISINDVPLDDLETGENFKEESNRHNLYRNKDKPKPRAPRGRSCKAKIWTREEIRQVYGKEKCPYTWEEIAEKLRKNITITLQLHCRKEKS